MHAPFAALMRLSAMLPLASTTNSTSAPALRASFLLRISGFSTYTRRCAVPLSIASWRRIYRSSSRILDLVKLPGVLRCCKEWFLNIHQALHCSKVAETTHHHSMLHQSAS
jgi:hypothetical protein